MPTAPGAVNLQGQPTRGSSTGSALGLGALVLVGLHACKREQPSPTGPTSPASPDSAACGLDTELESLTRTAEAPEQAAAELRRPLLGPAQARAYAAAAAKAAVDALANNSYSELADLVDPRRGLCLRPAKGASCRQMSIQELRGCGEAKSKERWGVDDGSDEGPSYTCREAFARIFFARDFRRPNAVRYNCFPEVGRGNNADTILSPPVHRAYVEYFVDEQQAVHAGEFPLPWRSLWLVFDRDAPRLVELIAEYWGP